MAYLLVTYYPSVRLKESCTRQLVSCCSSATLIDELATTSCSSYFHPIFQCVLMCTKCAISDSFPDFKFLIECT